MHILQTLVTHGRVERRLIVSVHIEIEGRIEMKPLPVNEHVCREGDVLPIERLEDVHYGVVLGLLKRASVVICGVIAVFYVSSFALVPSTTSSQIPATILVCGGVGVDVVP